VHSTCRTSTIPDIIETAAYAAPVGPSNRTARPAHLRPTWRPPNGYGGTNNADAHAENPFGPIDEPTAEEPKHRRGRPRKNKDR
jgi:hypothetical protein